MILVSVLLVGLALFTAYIFWHHKTTWTEKEHFPPELQHRKILCSEKFFELIYPLRLCGKVDQVYKTEGRTVCPIDTKTRTRVTVYQSDIIQLSVYAYILRHKRRWLIFEPYAVTPFGFIRVETPDGKVHYKKVQLLDDSDIEQLYRRYRQIEIKKVTPTFCTTPGFCAKCAYKKYCKQPATA